MTMIIYLFIVQEINKKSKKIKTKIYEFKHTITTFLSLTTIIASLKDLILSPSLQNSSSIY